MPHETEENKYKLLLEFFPTIHSTYGISHWGKCLYLNRNRWNFLGGNHSVATFIGEIGNGKGWSPLIQIILCTSTSTQISVKLMFCLYHINRMNYTKSPRRSSLFCAKVIIFLIAFMKKKEKHAGKPQTVLWDGGIILNKSVWILFTGTYLIFFVSILIGFIY